MSQAESAGRDGLLTPECRTAADEALAGTPLLLMKIMAVAAPDPEQASAEQGSEEEGRAWPAVQKWAEED